MRPTEPVRVQESIEENKNEEEIMENINKEEDEETRIMRSRFEEILHTLTSSTKEILKRETTADEAEERSSKRRD